MSETVEPKTKMAHEKFCSNCGATISAQAEICPKCGVRQAGAMSANAKSRTTAAVLAFFLGGFGAHRFYLGHVGLGIVYILFFWTFIPAIVAFIELIIFLTMSDDAFNQKYNSLR